MVGRAMLTTVASSAAIPEPSTVIASTQRPGAEEYVRTGASAWVISCADFQRFDVRLAVDYLTGNQACRFLSLCMRPDRRRRDVRPADRAARIGAADRCLKRAPAGPVRIRALAGPVRI